MLLKYLFQLQEFYNCRSVILNKTEKCWNDSSLTEERHPGRNDDSLLGEQNCMFTVCTIFNLLLANKMLLCHIHVHNIDNSIILSCAFMQI